jgi:uncharacterized repeat protein (TIGR03803 family)
LGNTLYGTAASGGNSGDGTVFEVNTDGTGFTTLHSFSGSDGTVPEAGLFFFGDTLYGTASLSGSSGSGTVFAISLGLTSAPQLTIAFSRSNILLTWPTNATGFTLQSTTNLGLSAAWTNVTSAPVIVDGCNTVTNAISDARRFYRLKQ